MSWNSTFVAINRDFSDQFDKLQADLGVALSEPLQTVSWEEATSSTAAGKSVGFGDGWTIICDPQMFLDVGDVESYDPSNMWLPRFEQGLKTCSIGSKALGFIMAGVSGTYGMTIHDNGELLRCRLIQENETVIDFGEPPSEEIETFAEESDEEQRAFFIMEKFGLSFENLENIQFTLYESAAA